MWVWWGMIWQHGLLRSCHAISYYSVFLPPASAVEVIESEPCVCVCVSVCLSVCTLLPKPFNLWSQSWRHITNFGAKGLENVRRGRYVNAQAFSFQLRSPDIYVIMLLGILAIHKPENRPLFYTVEYFFSIHTMRRLRQIRALRTILPLVFDRFCTARLSFMYIVSILARNCPQCSQ